MKSKKLLLITDKVMPYRSSFYRELAKMQETTLKVIYLDKWGVENKFDQTLNIDLAWDGPILEGFDYHFVDSISLFKAKYTGADKVKVEHIPIIGNIIYYSRVFIGILSWQYIKLLIKDRSDIFIIEGYVSINFILALIIGKIRRKKVILRGESYLHGNKPFYITVIKSLYLRSILPLFDVIFYGSKANKDFYIHYGVKEQVLTFVPSAVDHDFFKKEKNRIKSKGNSLEKRIHKKDKIVFLAIGRFVKRKRWEDFLEALGKINRLDIISIFIGDGPHKSIMKQVIHKYDIKNIYFEGFKNQTEISEYYEFADIFVLPSDYDPTPKVLNEALEFGLPVLLSNSIGTANELCKNNGYIFEKGNIDDLKSKIELIIKNKLMYSKFSANSLKLASEWSLKNGIKNIKNRLELLDE